jgi:virulence factor Mce-like protein
MAIFDRSASHEPSALTIVAAAVASVAVLAALVWIAIIAPRGVPGLNYYRINAQFDDASQIADLSQVRIAGRHIGQVKKSSLRNGKATVQLQLYPGQGPLRSDSTARIRLKGALGAKYVELTPGTRGSVLPDGGTLPASQTSTATDVLDILQSFDARTRRHLQIAVRGLGEGFLARGKDINAMLQVSPEFFGGLRRAANTVLVTHPGAAARLFPSLEKLSSAYDPVREEAARGFAPEARALGAFADRRTAIDRTLVEAPPALTALRQGLDTATPLLHETAGFARATTQLTKRAPAALRETSLLLRAARPGLRDAKPLLETLSPAVSPTLRFLRTLNPEIEPSIRALRNNIDPFAELARHSCDVLGFVKNWRSTLGFGVQEGFGDLTGTLDDGPPGLGPLDSLRVLVVRPAEAETLNADSPPVDAGVKRNPYPSPCAALSEKYP